ncbi:FG-GAP-like repeat-containing protein [Armatimonas rosea]|uniref:Tetratricopeptide (TPR) repeat protein n=1 Tax=Armatimonas rosea TaxID=685828 RepID=A0A7W9W6D3_ARMRO|nr:tetratricopeptide (TPR) repeat protein [Armatimonas rosea]
MKRSFLSLLALPLLVLGSGCNNGQGGGSSSDPGAAISAFYIGTLALQTGEQNHPVPSLERALKLAPDEPAIAANLALAYTRKNDQVKANEFLALAKKGAPDDTGIVAIEALILKNQGKYAEAIAAYQRVIVKDPTNIKVLFRLAELGQQLSGPDGDAVRKKALEGILATRPDNLPTQLKLAQQLARARDTAGLASLLTAFEARKSRWNAAAQAKLAIAKTKVGMDQFIQLAQLEKILLPSLDYKAGLSELQTSEVLTGEPLQHLLKLPTPPATPAKPDTGLTYLAPTPATGTLALALSAESKPVVLPLPAGATAVAPFDFDDIKGAWESNAVGAKHPGKGKDRNFRLELAAAGPSGLKIYENGTPLATKLPPGPCTGVWAVDIEVDGDLDLIVSPAQGKPYVLQNNGDRTFTVTPPKFDAVAAPIRSLAWADFDGDGDNDLAFVDANGKLIRYTNERSGAFKLDTSTKAENLVAVAVAEVTGDTTLDLLGLEKGGQVVAFVNNQRLPLLSAKLTSPQQLLVADFDNNGATDLLIVGKNESELWLSDGPGKFVKEPIAIPFAVTSSADLNDDGLLDLVGTKDGKPVQSLAQGKEKYHYLTLTLMADSPDNVGDKINTFCLGGAFEARAGLLYQIVPVTGPQMHLGLGTYEKPDVVRMLWTNGRAQSEFGENIKPSKPIVADQALGGSCPFLFTWNGKEFVFVTDCIWRSPLGLKINAQDTAGATQTEDWVKVRGDQLAARNGTYELSITAELNETHYFDHLSLLTVDHPENTEIFIDERFNPTQPPLLKVIPTGPTQPFAQVLGFKGQDVSEVVAERDTHYLDDFGRGKYQGIAGDHWVELALPESAPKGKPLYLIAYGWLHPTNTSLNVAMSQDKSQGPPQGLSLWTPDSKGGWAKRRDALGFPAGKLKTVVLRLDDVFAPGSPRRLRLRTNLEVFWDQLQWAEARPDNLLKVQRLSASEVTLRYRGFSAVQAADASSPELPQSYRELAGLTPRWRDLTGYVTRFGDVKPLLTGVDDRYAILNAGDELFFRFPAKTVPPAGYKRDFVVISDGWEKDGNINTTHGKTVGPYPLHALKDYPKSYASLTDDPAYQKHPDDFATYHTRWVTPERFLNAYLPPSSGH